MKELLKELLTVTLNKESYYMVKINKVAIFFDTFKYDGSLNMIQFYNNGIHTADIFEPNLHEFRIV